MSFRAYSPNPTLQPLRIVNANDDKHNAAGALKLAAGHGSDHLANPPVEPQSGSVNDDRTIDNSLRSSSSAQPPSPTDVSQPTSNVPLYVPDEDDEAIEGAEVESAVILKAKRVKLYWLTPDKTRLSQNSDNIGR